MSRTEELKKRINKKQADTAVIKKCPICGALPELTETDLDRGNGHGYPGWFTYSYKCPRCGLLEAGEYMYQSEDKCQSRELVKNRALNDWNELVDYINKLIDRTRGK